MAYKSDLFKPNLAAIVGSILWCTILLLSCSKAEQSPSCLDSSFGVELTATYIDIVCCGNLITVDEQLVATRSGSRQDSLLGAANMDDFARALDLDFGDEVSITFEVTGEEAGFCGQLCNRWNAIPIRLCSVSKL